MHRLRVLIVAYAFPPVGGVGVQRAAKLAKFLPELGFDVSVLTVENPSVPLTDHSYAGDIGAATVHRARTLEPSYRVKKAGWEATARSEGALPSWRTRWVAAGVRTGRQLLVPDPQVLWLPGAATKLARIAADFDVALITAPPFSQFLLSPILRQRGVGVVLDYRDEWSTLRESYEMLQGGLSQAVGKPLEASLLKRADAVVAATGAFRDNLLSTFDALDPARVHTIENGYDPADFPVQIATPPTDHMVISYAGTVYRLTSARGLLGAVRRLHATEPQLAKLLRLRFMGRIVDTELDAFDGMDALGVERLGFLPHDDVLKRLGESHMNLIIVADSPGTKRIYPAKTFELMHLGRPMLTLAPEGELTALVRTLRLGAVLPPDDEGAICAALVHELRAFRDREGRPATPEFDAVGVARFHRRALAERFGEVLRKAASRARVSAS